MNPHVTSLFIKLESLLTQCQDPEGLQQISRIFRTHAYSDQLELVRVATVKSVSRILEKLGTELNEAQWIAGLDLMVACIYLLNDEHPEIRTYLVQSLGARRFFADKD